MANEEYNRNTGQLLNQVKECPDCGECYNFDDKFCHHHGTALTLSLPVNRIIEGKYHLDRKIGQGGMGAVYEATDLLNDRKVAIKILHMYVDQEALLRFDREARTSVSLSHPNIISVYDYGQLGRMGAYLAMELVQGFTLRSRLDKGIVDAETAADWFNQLCEGLKIAHEAKIIHRDLKPENIFISQKHTGQAVIKIFDFGLAKALHGDGATNITSPGTVLGTLGYMPPEQIMGEDADERSDIFSLGVMVAESITGYKPFDGMTVMQLMAATLQEIFHLEGNTPEILHLNEILQKCLAKRRRERYKSVAEMQVELIPALRKYRTTSDSPVH